MEVPKSQFLRDQVVYFVAKVLNKQNKSFVFNSHKPFLDVHLMILM